MEIGAQVTLPWGTFTRVLIFLRFSIRELEACAEHRRTDRQTDRWPDGTVLRPIKTAN